MGNMYISEYLGHRIRMVSAATRRIYTVAGTGIIGSTGDGNYATSSFLQNPLQIYVDFIGNLWIADFGNNRIRKVNPQGMRVHCIFGVFTVIATFHYFLLRYFAILFNF